MLSTLVTLVFFVHHAHGDGADFSRVRPARDTEEALARFNERAQVAIDANARRLLDGFQFSSSGSFPAVAMARLTSGMDIARVNQILLDPKTVAYAQVGSDFHDLGFLCRRDGDYDFMLRGLVALVYRFKDHPEILWPESVQKIYRHLLTATGNTPHLINDFKLCGRHFETENHILMTEGSRYLTNQLLLHEAERNGRYEWRFDNEANGMNDWMLEHLQQFLKQDFSEYNSRPYQQYTVMALQNIYEFAEDRRVKLAAQIVMNYLDMKFAISSNGLRRHLPFRRKKEYRGRTDMLQVDGESRRFIVMAGNTQVLAELPAPYVIHAGLSTLLPAALGSYRVPAPVLDLVVRKDQRHYFQRFNHTGVELYSSSDSFLISAGGIWIEKFDMATGQNSGWALATTLMPTLGGIDAADFIRIEGNQHEKHRINTCVAPGFACGLNPVIPASVPASCLERSGRWTFIDFTAAKCPLKYGFFAVVYKAPCDSRYCKVGGESFGFFAAAEATPDLDFAEFKRRTLHRNGKTLFGSEIDSEYVTAAGRTIRFRPVTHSKYEWGISAFDGAAVETNIRKWPLAQGNVMAADGSGLVIFRNRHLRKQLTLDLREYRNPRRAETSY